MWQGARQEIAPVSGGLTRTWGRRLGARRKCCAARTISCARSAQISHRRSSTSLAVDVRLRGRRNVPHTGSSGAAAPWRSPRQATSRACRPRPIRDDAPHGDSGTRRSPSGSHRTRVAEPPAIPVRFRSVLPASDSQSDCERLLDAITRRRAAVIRPGSRCAAAACQASRRPRVEAVEKVTG